MVHDPDCQKQANESHDVVSVPENTISSENGKICGQKPKSQRPVKITQVQQYVGPLPPASELGVYEQILPGAAERILAMAEREQSHRHQREDLERQNEMEVTRGKITYTFRGQCLSFGFIVLLVGLTAILAYWKQVEAIGYVWGTTTCVIIGGMIWGIKFIRKSDKPSDKSSH
ncbi:MAG: DUF2335 domain-containing protein [Thermoguttaceae bacterium]|nr:DUF2335 domain-containing protein [Thermoguttaceae bacterium]